MRNAVHISSNKSCAPFVALRFFSYQTVSLYVSS